MCTTFVAKLILGVINFVIFVAGLAMFIVGLLIQTQPAFSQRALSSLLDALKSAASQAGVAIDTSNFSAASVAYSFSIPLLVFGIFLAIISIVGLLGVCCSSKILLTVYLVVTLVLFLAQLVLVLIAVINRNVFDDTVKPRLKDSITEYYSGMNGTDAATQIWNGVMLYLHCCGVDNYTDFNSATHWTRSLNGGTRFVTPLACCKNISTDYTCATAPTSANSNYMTGCYTEIWEYILSNSGIVIGIVVGILASQLVLLIFTYIVIRSTNKVGDLV